MILYYQLKPSNNIYVTGLKVFLITSTTITIMNNEEQKEFNSNHQSFLNQLDNLAEKAADAQAQIAGEGAKHEFRIKFKYYLLIAMNKVASETYSEILQEVQDFINQFAVGIADRTLEVESSTAKQIESFNADIPSFASFSETLASQRNQQSNLLRLGEVEVNSESDKQALSSLGINVNPESD